MISQGLSTAALEAGGLKPVGCPTAGDTGFLQAAMNKDCQVPIAVLANALSDEHEIKELRSFPWCREATELIWLQVTTQTQLELEEGKKSWLITHRPLQILTKSMSTSGCVSWSSKHLFRNSGAKLLPDLYEMIIL